MKKILAFLAVIVALGLALGFAPGARAGVFDPAAPKPPAGYHLTYSHDFTTQGNAGWTVQPGAGATVSNSTRFGLGIGMTQTNQWAEAILGNNSDYLVGPNSFVQALVYIPSGSGNSPYNGQYFPPGSSANWPAFWTAGNPWPQNGEIDALEVQHARSCEQTHYSSGPSSSTEISSQSNCGPLGADSTGWLTITMERSGGQVKEWYSHGSTVYYVGEVPLPTNAGEQLIFQNQSYSNSVCGNCFGPTLLGPKSTAWLSRVAVYNQ